MGLSSSSKTQKTTPVYGQQLEGAANNVTGAYNAAAPKITAISDAMGGLVPGLIDRYTNGDANINAAKAYNADVLGGRYLNGNPFLEDIVSRTGNDVRNQTTAALGTRGLTGGSAFGDIVSRNVGNSAATLRFNDYNTERSRMDGAVGAAAGLAGASEIPLASLQAILEAQKAPVSTAAGAGSAVGGLLGQYTNTQQKSSPSLMESIGQALNIAKTVGGFF